MSFQTNDFNVAKLELAKELAQSVETIKNTHVPKAPSDDKKVIDRAELITAIFNKLPTLGK